MLKKIITTVVLSVSALGMMAANATVPGVYVTGQLGYADTHNKDRMQKELNSLSNEAMRKGVSNIGPGNVSANKFAGRLAVGYQFNQNLAVEMGYLHLGQTKGNFTGELGSPKGTKVDGSAKLSQYALDLAAKGIVPLSEKFNVYAKLGVVYLTTNIKGSVTGTLPNGKDSSIVPEESGSHHKWAPEAAVGVSYDITPNVFVDGSWTHIQPFGKDRPGNVDFVAVGLGYNFG